QTLTNDTKNTHQKRTLECKDKMLHLGLLNAFGDFDFAFAIEQWHRADLLKIDKNRLVGLLFIAGFWRRRPLILRDLFIPWLRLIQPVFLRQVTIRIQIFIFKTSEKIFVLFSLLFIVS